LLSSFGLLLTYLIRLPDAYGIEGITPVLADATQAAEEPYAATRSAAILTMLSVLSPFSGLLVEMVLA